MMMPKTPTFADTEVTVCSEDFLLLLQAQRPSCGSLDWFREHRQEIMAALGDHGALFFRGFELGGGARQFEHVMDALVQEGYDMADFVTPRAHVRDTLYTSTIAPPAIDIPQHQEMSYRIRPPLYLGFYCEVPCGDDGRTPVNDLRKVSRDMRRLYPSVLDRFIEHGVLFVRNFNKFNYKTWQVCWEATTREEAEAKIRADDTEWEWVDGDWLRTFQRRPAVLRDPVTEQEIFYPSLNIFHRTFLEHIAGPANVPLPRSEAEQSMVAYYGDGSPIPEDFLAWLREQSIAGRVSIPYRTGDFLLINNLIVGHGRTPYADARRAILAAFRGSLDLRALQLKSPTAGRPEAAPAPREVDAPRSEPS